MCRHRRQYEFEDEALKWLDKRHQEEVVEGGSATPTPEAHTHE